MADKFRVGITRDCLRTDGEPVFDRRTLKVLDEAGIAWEVMPEVEREIKAETAAKYDALAVLGARVTRATLCAPDSRVKLVARFGVGYDTVDVPACTERGVLLTITPDGVRRPVALSVLTFLLMLAHRVPLKDRLVREGRWNEKLNYLGTGLSGRVLGSVGVGNIGSEVFRLATPLGMRFLACDPYVTQESVAPLGVKLVDMDTLFRESDFVTVNCFLSEETRHLVGAKQFAQMKPSACFINTARGPIVDEKALYAALASGKIAGRLRAGTDAGRQPDPEAGQRHRHAAPHLHDRRVHRFDRGERVQVLRGPGQGPGAAQRRQPAGAGEGELLSRLRSR
jgi:phosphoglycerate dehydrogenase-like enzyme